MSDKKENNKKVVVISTPECHIEVETHDQDDTLEHVTAIAQHNLSQALKKTKKDDRNTYVQ